MQIFQIAEIHCQNLKKIKIYIKLVKIVPHIAEPISQC